ncbi:MAG: hypothetical protein AUJ74_03930 [Candidatus Omnitrophica bacterium CG1_02_44_16]|nr:MAG: hypothetical protein AUJ74_03930 [Candidatus Omnitrophica bacterium CG1_02_44_16]PIY82744.1 MAG: peptidoglycan editing factor PgeF [Candidatus Omnitrophica bacterium CG_4_10_14_0_8_um_filter_44_12]PIZ84991.1 MAG: peptidoglycan editing factor PgeF [Candidatus Omnitrophica bacterium CG_4_10_14_0_2_um_filter_44_9]
MPQPLVLKKSNGFYEIPLFEEFNARAVFTTREKAPDLYKMGISGSRLILPTQVHGDRVFCVDADAAEPVAQRRKPAAREHQPEADALITRCQHLPLAIRTADCLPVFLFDTGHRAIAMIHAGWKGTHKKIISKTIKQMGLKFSTSPGELIAVLGPAIRQCCYEVGEEFRGFFGGFVSSRDSRLYFDICSATVNELLEAGVKDGRIYDSAICTSCRNDEFFSFRREGLKAGRSFSVMEIL